MSYQPYRDLEPGLYAALSAAFAKVAKVNGATDPKVAAEGLKYIVRPLIATTSDSPSLFTWPPTVFTVELICSVLDLNGKTVLVVRAAGEGKAEFDEFKMDPSLSAKRAAEVALEKLIRAFTDSTISLN